MRRMVCASGGVKLSIILCAVEGDTTAPVDGHIPIPEHLVEVVKNFSLQPFVAVVSLSYSFTLDSFPMCISLAFLL